MRGSDLFSVCQYSIKRRLVAERADAQPLGILCKEAIFGVLCVYHADVVANLPKAGLSLSCATAHTHTHTHGTATDRGATTLSKVCTLEDLV